MKKRHLFSVVILILIGLNPNFGQSSESKSLDDYQIDLPKYQKWLDYSGLGEILFADKFEQHRQHIHLIIKPKYAKGDSSMIAWKTLKQDYDAQHPHNLEEILFFNAVNAFKIRPGKLKVEILDDYTEPDLLVELSFDSEQRKIIKKEIIPKSKTADFSIDIGDIKNEGVKIDPKDNMNSRKQAYETILEYARNEFSKKNKGEKVEFGYKPGNNEKLEFSVVGLRQEVLKDKNNYWLADFYNWVTGSDKDWRPVEVLKFYVTYKNSNNGQIEIHTEIDGRYGSGFHETTDWNKCTPIDPEFDWYLQDYTDKFSTKLYELLSKE